MTNQTPPLAVRIKVGAFRLITSTLKLLGLRERVLHARVAKARRARLAAGPDDPISRPALHAMDTKLDELFGGQTGGFFIEAGANDGYTQSNTYFLERFRGWGGLLVEPMQELHDQCKAERPGADVVRAALVPFDYDQPTVTMRFAELMSVVAGPHEDEWRTSQGRAVGWRDAYEAQVPAETLTAILDRVGAPEIDLLSLDVEGFEPSVLAGLDFDRHAPRWVLIEVHDEAVDRPPLDAVLGERYELHDRLSPVDLLWRRADVTV